MKRYYVFFNFGIMPDPKPEAEGYATREEAQAFIDTTATPHYYNIIEMDV